MKSTLLNRPSSIEEKRFEKDDKEPPAFVIVFRQAQYDNYKSKERK
jgi:hypothetical protein